MSSGERYVWKPGHPDFESPEFRECLTKVSRQNPEPASDADAGNLYRLAQAAYYLESLYVAWEDDEGNIHTRPAYVDVGDRYVKSIDPGTLGDN